MTKKKYFTNRAVKIIKSDCGQKDTDISPTTVSTFMQWRLISSVRFLLHPQFVSTIFRIFFRSFKINMDIMEFFMKSMVTSYMINFFYCVCTRTREKNSFRKTRNGVNVNKRNHFVICVCKMCNFFFGFIFDTNGSVFAVLWPLLTFPQHSHT